MGSEGTHSCPSLTISSRTLLAVLRAVGMSAGSLLTADPGVLPAPQEQDVQSKAMPGTLLSLGGHHTRGLPTSASWENQKSIRTVVGQ